MENKKKKKWWNGSKQLLNHNIKKKNQPEELDTSGINPPEQTGTSEFFTPDTATAIAPTQQQEHQINSETQEQEHQQITISRPIVLSTSQEKQPSTSQDKLDEPSTIGVEDKSITIEDTDEKETIETKTRNEQSETFKSLSQDEQDILNKHNVDFDEMDAQLDDLRKELEEYKKNQKNQEKIARIFNTLTKGTLLWLLGKYSLYYGHQTMSNQQDTTLFESSNQLTRFARKTLGISYQLMEGTDNIVEHIAMGEWQKISRDIYNTETKIVHLYSGNGYQRKEVEDSWGIFDPREWKKKWDEKWIDIKDLGYLGEVIWNNGFNQNTRNVISMVIHDNGLLDIVVKGGKEYIKIKLGGYLSKMTPEWIPLLLNQVGVESGWELLPDTSGMVDNLIGRSKPLTQPIADGVEYIGDKVMEYGGQKFTKG